MPPKSASPAAPAADPAKVEPPVEDAPTPLAAAPREAPAGAAFVAHPEGIGCSFRGIPIIADEDGVCLVPLAAVDDLAAHGFVKVS